MVTMADIPDRAHQDQAEENTPTGQWRLTGHYYHDHHHRSDGVAE